MNWDDQAIRTLRQLWAEGLTTADIGMRLGCTKNAAIGKANRLGLAARGSPIKGRQGGTCLYEAARKRRAELTARAVAMAREGHAAPEIARCLGVHTDTVYSWLRAVGESPLAGKRRAPLAVAKPIEPAAPIAPHPLMRGEKVGCRFPIGTPRTPGFRFCDAPPVRGKPYCAACCDRAYARQRVEEAA